MLILFSVLIFLIVATAIAVPGYVYFVKPSKILQRLEDDESLRVARSSTEAAASGWTIVTTLEHLGEKLPLSPDEASLTRKELAAAGYRGANAVPVYLGIKVVCAVVLAVFVFLIRSHITANPVLGIVLTLAACGAGYFLPVLALDSLVDRRRESLRFSLPDALDLLVVAVEAGLGLDQALRVVSRELALTHKALCEEFSLLALEVRAGTPRSVAFTNLADRTGEAEMRKFATVLIQTDRFGTSVGEALRTHSEYLRVRRKYEAEERAGKVGVKLVFPIFFLIMPAILVVTAGPGVLMLFKQLANMMNDVQLR